MIKDLIIKNLILMDSCHLQLSQGLTIITGETGAGKTAVLQGLKLLLGQKFDPSLLRKGQTKGLVQARFELSSSPLKHLLTEHGIQMEEESDLLLSRELSLEGKSKCFIQDQLVSLSLLQKVSSHLLRITDQHSHQELKSAEEQRKTLDLFASLKQEVHEFKELFEETKKSKELEEELASLERQRERELSFCLSQLQELQSIASHDEEALFQEYALASKSQEILAQTDKLFYLLTQGKDSSLAKAQQAKAICSELTPSHAVFDEAAQLLEQAIQAKQEALHLLRSALSSFDIDPSRLDFLQDILNRIDKIQRKYGSCRASRAQYEKSIQEKVTRFEALDIEKAEAAAKHALLRQTLTTKASFLSQKRQKAAKHMKQMLTQELKELNMPDVSLEVRIEKQATYTATGEDVISFWMSPNLGESLLPIKDSSSGGELARLLFAIQCSLAEKNETPTLIFDEIDANVGGQTARHIGEKLRSLASHRQIICITHFPQVACQADLHLRVQKLTDKDRTSTTIERLEGKQKEEELMRMIGGEKTLSFYADP